jgi:hypothetical protein
MQGPKHASGPLPHSAHHEHRKFWAHGVCLLILIDIQSVLLEIIDLARSSLAVDFHHTCQRSNLLTVVTDATKKPFSLRESIIPRIEKAVGNRTVVLSTIFSLLAVLSVK